MTQIIKRIGGFFFVVVLATNMLAQTNGCNSSYSRFGLGLPCDQSQGFNRGMGGVAQGFRSSTQVNMLNPASYSAIDSLTFIFDAGMKLQMGHFSMSGTSSNALNTSLEYINTGFRLAKNLGMSLGFVPFSTIGYNFNSTGRVGYSVAGKVITTETTYYGNGGLHELYIGMGWKPFGDFSIGANIGYLWGDYNHSMAQSFYEGGSASSTYNAQNEVWKSDMKTYKLDIGIQYPIRLNAKNGLTLGITAGIGHRIGSKVELLRYTSLGDSIQTSITDAFDLPYTITSGLAWNKDNQLTIGADYSYERWKGCRVAQPYATATSSGITIATDQYSNRHHIAVGADYIRNSENSSKYLDHIHFRVGATYSTSYLKVNGVDGPMEYGMTAGVGLPLKTSTRSLINVSVQWLRRVPSAKNLITENYLMFHAGITFNEQWFMKWKLK